jgi:hypothetical protein
MTNSLTDLVYKLAYYPENHLITKPASSFCFTSLGHVVDRASCRRYGRTFPRRARLARERWLIKEFPKEAWDLPMLTAFYLGEACSCYVNGEYFATLAMCHAVNESFVRGAYRAAKRSMEEIAKRDGRERRRMKTWSDLLDELEQCNLTPAGKRYLKWIARLRNTILHVGTDRDYAKAIKLATAVTIARGKTLPIPALATICKITLSVTIQFVGSNSVHRKKMGLD